MSAIDEPRDASEAAGKSIPASDQLTVDEATRATLPQLRYADAVWAAHQELALIPDALETGVRAESPGGGRELFIRLEWLPGHEELARPAVKSDGLTVEWSHLAGWIVRSGDDLHMPDLDQLAAPEVVADLAMHAALCGPGCACPKVPAGRWEHAVYLDVALVAYDERTGGQIG
ncbi:hypothetical protein ACIP10_15525 [Streptomyces galbus]|uniref:hypothetical protein n=1 Tax=Streptomyces galbus TaxID=33898 RepID=UPI0037B93F16